MKYLDEALIAYSRTDAYPFHMPGHKRTALPFPNPYTVDITEIDGFDNLHHAQGVIREAEERAAALYGSQKCYYLVNGSTCGLLAAVCAAAKKGDRVLVARNCHKAVYHALFLHELRAEYLYPVITGRDLQGQILPTDVETALRENPDIAAVILTSPTYEGILSDIEEIARVSHERGVPLIVDSAHGAHLGFGGGFPESAVHGHADAVVMSLHKTLPSFTQTALLHLTSDRIVAEEVERYLGIFETSSPSYLFFAGMDACMHLLTERREEYFEAYRKRLDAFYGEVKDLRYLSVMCRGDMIPGEMHDWDDSKLVIFTKGKNGSRPENSADRACRWQEGISGKELYLHLRDRYHLQMEMTSADYVLGMTSIMDTEEDFARLSRALHELDDKIGAGRKDALTAERQETVEGVFRRRPAGIPSAGFTAQMYQQHTRGMEIYQAVSLPYREASVGEAVGRISADSVYLYPPGIPLIVPGEVIEEAFLDRIRYCLGQGLLVEGQANLSAERIKIVYF